ncbi:hypothetical protein FGA82_26205 [Pseudomonas fluorescens]|uniref:hypothetical protein n=1 Tax=Pseudomonas fluorescens TaxID=294 RepID=UPI00112FFB3D|nr:hypothetical protein [Pseudomonas fluorescens]TMU71561.1 hypothetical protein FGA82_26205 [Pseudomonas fluorescens]
MTKSTKITVRPVSPDTSTLTRSDTVTGSGRNTGSPDTSAPDSHRLPDTSGLTERGADIVVEPRVVVNYITDPVITEANARLAEISLPGLQTHLLRPHESLDGLYLAPDGQTYAHLEEGGYYRAELNTDGDYQIPWPAAPGVTPPILRKIAGQPRWRIEAQWYAAESAPGSLFMPRLTAEDPVAIFHVDPNLATLLPAVHESTDGIRQGPRGKTYVDLADGTVMIRKSAQGEYKLASATTMNVPDITLEQIPGRWLWRRKPLDAAGAQPNRSPAHATPEETGPGPSKRARLPGESDPLAPRRPIEDWKTWGTATKPLAGDFIEIDGKHFSILEQPTHAVDALAFIKHPQFSATRFDTFEQMLLTTPELQPRGVVKLADRWTGRGGETWRMVEGLPFGKCLTQYVSDQFAYLSYASANKAAREMFNRANHSDAITGPGLNALFETFRYWENRSTYMHEKRVLRQDLSDPLMLLSPLPTDENGYMHMPLLAAEGLQRIDFNAQLFSASQYQVDRASTRDLALGILRGHGYNVSTSFRSNAQDALLIQRAGIDSVFILFTDRFDNATTLATDPTIWLKRKALVNKIDPDDKITLQDHHATNKIIYLACTNMRLAPSWQDNLVITRLR